MFGCLGEMVKIVMVAENKKPVKSAQGPQTVIDYSFDDCPQLDLILLPGGWGTVPALSNPAILNFLQKQAPQSENTMSVCTGSALLAKAGLLNGRRATTNKQYFALATQTSDQVDWVESARWVVDGNYVTASGVSAGIDMALAVIANLYGQETAQRIANVTEYNWQTDPNHDPFTQFLNHGDTQRLINMYS
jgi:transcriptional regulator GlxA family with amidase domain